MKGFTLAFLALLGLAASRSYDGHKVVRIKTGSQLRSVEQRLSTLNYEEWDRNVARHIDVALPPDQLASFEAMKLDYRTMHKDLGASIKAESANSVQKRQVNDSSWFDSFHSYEDHVKYWDDLHTSFPDNSEPISSGTSYEGRDLFGLHLWGSGGPGKPAILWHASVHAREWITTMVVEYLTLQLITGYTGNNSSRSFLDQYDFYIIPFVNPDGFVYSQTQDRLWRKNRQPGPNNSTCFGRDINRQWPYEWNTNPLGASRDPCSQTYSGESASDGPESQGLVALVDELRDTNGIALYIDWHSYSQLIEFPYGSNCTKFPADAGKLTRVATDTSDAIYEIHGTIFIFGQACSTLYPTTGGSRDHVYEVGEADWSYTIELRDRGEFGFVLPPDQIRPSAEEQWNGIQVMIDRLDDDIFGDQG